MAGAKQDERPMSDGCVKLISPKGWPCSSNWMVCSLQICDG